MRSFELVACLLTLIPALIQATETCGAGLYLKKAGASWICRPCPHGFYQEKAKHSDTECKTCQIAEKASYEYEAEKCTPTRNTVILCDAKHYRVDYPDDPSLGHCQLCRVCGIGKADGTPFPIQPCGNYTDAVCSATDPTTPTSPRQSTITDVSSPGTTSHPSGNRVAAIRASLFLVLIHTMFALCWNF